MADPPAETPTHRARRPGRGARNRAFDVLLRFFANAVGADTALLLKGDREGRPRVLATAGRDGLEPAVPFVSGSFLGDALRADAQARIDRDPSQSSNGRRSAPVALAVAAPVRHGDRVLGALYAGFAVAPRMTDEELLWTADSYARMAALCIRSSHGLAAVLARSSWDELTGCLDRRGIHEALATEVLRSQREGHRLSCCLLGLDRVERLNESRGRLEANRVLAARRPGPDRERTPLRPRRSARRRQVPRHPARDRRTRRRPGGGPPQDKRQGGRRRRDAGGAWIVDRGGGMERRRFGQRPSGDHERCAAGGQAEWRRARDRRYFDPASLRRPRRARQGRGSRPVAGGPGYVAQALDQRPGRGVRTAYRALVVPLNGAGRSGADGRPRRPRAAGGMPEARDRADQPTVPSAADGPPIRDQPSAPRRR